MKLCEKCRNSYPLAYALGTCDAKIDSIMTSSLIPGLSIVCGGKVVNVHCGVCLDRGYVDIRDPRFPTPEKLACKRGCQQLEENI